ncbi:FecCD family ABC transporter permease [Amycolatopsis nalaikhensis]|uniref:Iron chelate uptake ABC transporter family permease subunit n=1 Tax=Amycolatopsis nalaikhensis TaxID=715472 RepID=A0ABY8XGI8_9PSEU|nr:iron chelate uptake ABC transporter family permease subunit [Amycolatopsis sp. 2-2]WIV54729.1 iron chelate uptake ABC transporter family permease subunit [Amycolatopsis sp. 2-2]
MRTDPGGIALTRRPPHSGRALGLLAALAVLVFLCLLSVWLGSKEISFGAVWQVLWHDDGSADAVIIHSVRMPRTLLAVLVGAGLGLAGTVMQALTRNPLADPGLLGVSAGAAFAIVFSITVLGVSSLYGYIWFAFAGALAATAVVYFLGTRGRAGSSPVKLALAGAAVTALLASFTSAMVLADPVALNRYRFWSAGSLSGVDGTALLQVLPFFAVGVVLAIASGPALNSLALGDDVAIALGRKLGPLRLRGALAITLLTGAAVAVAGPIVFLGLIVPHAVRFVIGPDHRWLLPYTAVLAPCLLLAADILGRIMARPGEIRAGVIVAFLGAPFFIYLVRRRKLVES